MKHVSDRLFGFISGTLTSREAAEIAAHLAECRACRSAYARELKTEAALYNLNEAGRIPAGRWAASIDNACEGAGIHDDNAREPVVTGQIWDQAVQNALATVRPRQKIIIFRPVFYKALAAAACVAAVFGFMFLRGPAEPPRAFRAPEKPLVVRMANLDKSEVVCKNHERKLIRMTGHTGVALGRSSKLRVPVNREREFKAELVQGMALFSVEKKKYRTFLVGTPHADVRVTGTAFKVEVSGLETRLSVVSGSVDFIPHGGKPLKALTGDRVVLKNGLHREKIAENQFRNLLDEEAELAAIFPPDPVPPALSVPARALPAVRAPAVKPAPAAASRALGIAARIDAYFKSADSAKARGRYTEAIGLYRKIAAIDSVSHAAQTALHEINMTYLHDLSDADKAREGLESYLSRFPNNDWTEEALFALINIHVREKHYRKAADRIAQYIGNYPDGQNARELLYTQATLLRAELKEYGEASRAYQRFLDRYPSDYRAVDAKLWLDESKKLIKKGK